MYILPNITEREQRRFSFLSPMFYKNVALSLFTRYDMLHAFNNSKFMQQVFIGITFTRFINKWVGKWAETCFFSLNKEKTLKNS